MRRFTKTNMVKYLKKCEQREAREVGKPSTEGAKAYFGGRQTICHDIIRDILRGAI